MKEPTQLFQVISYSLANDPDSWDCVGRSVESRIHNKELGVFIDLHGMTYRFRSKIRTKAGNEFHLFPEHITRAEADLIAKQAEQVMADRANRYERKVIQEKLEAIQRATGRLPPPNPFDEEACNLAREILAGHTDAAYALMDKMLENPQWRPTQVQ